mgnify:FL=1
MRKDAVIFCFNDSQVKVLKVFDKLHLLRINGIEVYSHVITKKPEYIAVSVTTWKWVHRLTCGIIYKFVMDDSSFDRADRMWNSFIRTEEGAKLWEEIQEKERS